MHFENVNISNKQNWVLIFEQAQSIKSIFGCNHIVFVSSEAAFTADDDAYDVTPSSNARIYTLRSIPSPGQ